jgi:RNA polymerase sigma factor (sigma-70 family)
MVVELRYFVGLTGEEVAESLGISRPTVQRRWKTARAWLYRYLKAESGKEQGKEKR